MRINLETIDTFPFGSVECLLLANHEDKGFETQINYGIHDLVNFMQSLYWFYCGKPKRTQRQKEIADLAIKLATLLQKEKRVKGRIWSPIVLDTKQG